MRAFDTGPGAPTQTVLDEGTLKAPRGNVSFDLTPKGMDKVQFTYRKEGQKPRHTGLKRGRGERMPDPETHARSREITKWPAGWTATLRTYG